MDKMKELVRQFIFFTSILSGFSLSIVVQLISLQSKKRVTAWAIGTLSVASLAMLTATLLGSLLIVRLEAYPDPMSPEIAAQTGNAGVVAFFLLLISLVAFMVGVGLIGWIYSKTIGIVLAVFAALALATMLWALIALFPY